MGNPSPRHHYTYREYLALEEASNVKHEYFDGEIYAMAGGTPEHAALAVAVSSTLFAHLRGGPCRVYSSDLRVRVLPTGLATYPDVTVICGSLECDPESAVTATNPKVIVEVLSNGTEDYDRGEKLEHYQKIPSLEAILLVSHRARRIEILQCAKETPWTARSFGAGETVEITALACRLSVDDIYSAVGYPGIS